MENNLCEWLVLDALAQHHASAHRHSWKLVAAAQFGQNLWLGADDVVHRGHAVVADLTTQHLIEDLHRVLFALS
jgi:hypothetical protein